MALIVAFQNISGLRDASNYEVTIYVNETQIAGPVVVQNHTRDDGWKVLVKKFAASLEDEIVEPVWYECEGCGKPINPDYGRCIRCG